LITTTFIEANGLRFEVDQCGDGQRLALFLHGFLTARQLKKSWYGDGQLLQGQFRQPGGRQKPSRRGPRRVQRAWDVRAR
jgi:hypothetical protein